MLHSEHEGFAVMLVRNKERKMKGLGPEKLLGERRIRERGGADACLMQVIRWAGVPVKAYFPEKLLGERRIRGGGVQAGVQIVP